MAAATASASVVAAAAEAMNRLRFLDDELGDAQRGLHADLEGQVPGQSRYRELFEGAPDGYVLTNRWGAITHANLAAAQLVNVPAAYLPGKPLALYVCSDDRQAFRRVVDQARRNRREDIMLRLTPREKPVIVAHFTATMLGTDREGASQAIRWIIRDVTEQRAGEQRLVDSRHQLGELAAAVSLAEERERRRIAVGIHDRVSQPLALAKMNLGRLRAMCEPEGQQVVDSASFLLQQAIDESRSLTFELSPPVLYELGLVAAVEWLGEQFHRQNGLRVDVKTIASAAEDGLALDGRVMLFQAIRELLTNVVKHAEAHIVTISFSSKEHQFSVRVLDDGLGFDVTAAQKPERASGFGLFSIRTRLEQMGGSLTIRSTPGRGSCAELVLPVQSEKGKRKRPRNGAEFAAEGRASADPKPAGEPAAVAGGGGILSPGTIRDRPSDGSRKRRSHVHSSITGR